MYIVLSICLLTCNNRQPAQAAACVASYCMLQAPCIQNIVTGIPALTAAPTAQMSCFVDIGMKLFGGVNYLESYGFIPGLLFITLFSAP